MMLRNKSFREQDLTGADFQKANLRGCDFQGAILRNANLKGVKTGRSLWQWSQLIAIIIGVLYLGISSIYGLIFPVLGGRLMAGTTGILIIVLYLVLMIQGFGILLLHRFPQVGINLSSSLSGALLGFFYGGKGFDKALIPAVVGMFLVAGFGYLCAQYQTKSLLKIGLMTINTFACSATVFLLGSTALSGLAVFHWLGFIFTGLTLIYLWLTWLWSLQLENAITEFGGTSFKNADLTDANFAGARLGKTCFTGAIGIIDH